MVTSVLLVAATSAEAEIVNRIKGIVPVEDGFRFGDFSLNVLVTGAGGMSTAWAMKQWLTVNPVPDLVINIGIAGSYSGNILKGDAVMVGTDCFADLGIESGDNFMTLAEAGLENPDAFPFEAGVIKCENRYSKLIEPVIKKVKAITVNTCTGSQKTTDRLRKKFNPDIETMEGATFFYICSREKIPFLAVRSISNEVGPRNRDSWDIPLALNRLTEMMNKILMLLD
jgi:futalosine hydrolase